MATALAHSRPATTRTAHRPDLRVARPIDGVDLDAALADALAPHRAAARQDAHVADVVDLDAHRRLTSPRVRRNRLRAVLVALALAAAIAVAVGSLTTAGADAPPAPPGEVVVVEPGQTLWDVARQHTPAGGDPRATLDDIRDHNGLTGTTVPAWTPVAIP